MKENLTPLDDNAITCISFQNDKWQSPYLDDDF